MCPVTDARVSNSSSCRTLCLVSLVIIGLHYGQMAKAEEGRPASVDVNFEQGLLSVDARNAPLSEVMRTVAGNAGFDLFITGSLDTPITWSL